MACVACHEHAVTCMHVTRRAGISLQRCTRVRASENACAYGLRAGQSERKHVRESCAAEAGTSVKRLQQGMVKQYLQQFGKQLRKARLTACACISGKRTKRDADIKTNRDPPAQIT